MPRGMIDFDAGGSPAPAYLATPSDAPGPAVVVLHAWWGLTEPFRQVCDRLAEAGFTALAPDLYRGTSATTVEEAEALAEALDGESERARGDLAGAVQFLRQDSGANLVGGRGALALVGFSLGGAYALRASVESADEIAAVVTFYTSYTGPDYRQAQAAYLCHFAENDLFDPPEVAEEMKQAFETAGRPSTFYTYPGTAHWFMEANRPDVYDAAAAALAWDRTMAFLNAQLRQA